jgi:uncharacterized protein YqjF (DUF2071 family)
MSIDRIAPSRREACRTRQSGHQTWRDLLFVHWAVPEEALRSLVPSPLSIDLFDGHAYVGLVPFTMHDVRVGPLVVADFLETNVRTYVHAEGVPGVWFFSLDAERSLAVWGGRWLYRLPYFRAAMACARNEGAWDYRLQRRRSLTDLRVRWSLADERPHLAAPGTLEHFLTERYALYGREGRNGVYRVRVHHPPWPLRRARLERLSTSLLAASSIDVGAPIDLVLASVEGVAVETFAKERVLV